MMISQDLLFIILRFFDIPCLYSLSREIPILDYYISRMIDKKVLKRKDEFIIQNRDSILFRYDNGAILLPRNFLARKSNNMTINYINTQQEMSQIMNTARLCWFTGTYNIIVLIKDNQNKIQLNFVKVDKIKRSNKYTVLTFKGKTYTTEMLMKLSLNVSINIPLSIQSVVDHCEINENDLFIRTEDNKIFIYTNARKEE